MDEKYFLGWSLDITAACLEQKNQDSIGRIQDRKEVTVP
jgi:hypothetical protein